MKEIASTPQEVAAKLAACTVPGTTVIGPDIDERFGITARHNGSSVHVSLDASYWSILYGQGESREVDGRVFLDPVPEEAKDRPMADLVREWSPEDCALMGLPKDFKMSTDFNGESQAEWEVRVRISGLGAMRGVDAIKAAVFYIRPRQSSVAS